MCLGIPMKILEIDDLIARCEAKGIERDVILLLLQDEPANVGDYVVVHIGHAIEIVSESEALAAWAVYDEILALADASRENQDRDLPS